MSANDIIERNAEECARQLLEAGAEKLERLRAALQSQWEANHYEHCGHDDCVSFGGAKLCHWPRPIELDGHQQNTNVAAKDEKSPK